MVILLTKIAQSSLAPTFWIIFEDISVPFSRHSFDEKSLISP